MHTIEEIAALLHVHEKATAIGNLSNIGNSALNRLKEIDADMGTHGLGSTPPMFTVTEVSQGNTALPEAGPFAEPILPTTKEELEAKAKSKAAAEAKTLADAGPIERR